jgi:hypothetical protein
LLEAKKKERSPTSIANHEEKILRGGRNVLAVYPGAYLLLKLERDLQCSYNSVEHYRETEKNYENERTT